MRLFAFVALLALCAATPLKNNTKSSTDRIGSVSVQGDNTQVGETINNQFGHPSFPQNDFDQEQPQQAFGDQGYQPYDSGFGGGIDQVNVRGPNAQVANDLNNFGDRADLPALKASDKEHEYLHKAVAEVVKADKKVPEDKKDEVIASTVKEIKEELKASQMTHGQLIDKVEAEAAKHDAAEKAAKEASTDRTWGHRGHHGGHRHHHGRYGHHYGRYGYGGYYPGYYGYYSGYYPGYYPGYGYNDCLYGYSYGYCQQQLYGAYAYYRTAGDDEKISPDIKADETSKALMVNLTETSKKVETAAAKDRLEEASKLAENVKKIVDKAEDLKLIESKDAKAIHKAADNVRKSAAAGDQNATLEQAKMLKNRSLLGDVVEKNN